MCTALAEPQTQAGGTRSTSPGIHRVRVNGGLTLAFEARGSETYLAVRRERDGYKVRTPRGSTRAEAVLINTGGGVAGGDRVAIDVQARAKTTAVVTSAQAERVYGTAHRDPATISIRLTAGAGTDLAWLPQETILFDTSRLERSFDIDLASDAQFLMGELVIFGRSAMGEALHSGSFADRWRIRRDGRLTFADSVAFSGDLNNQLNCRGGANGARGVGTVVCIAPDAESKLAKLHATIDDDTFVAASRIDDMIVARILAPTGLAARNALARTLTALYSENLPRVWST